MSAAITIEGLGKSYVIRHQRAQSYVALRDVLTDSAKGFGRRLLMRNSTDQKRSSKEIFWALKDMNLEIAEGDRVGIIGRNGAGKSTLLKILSRITPPTTGRLKIMGRLASLLEVGTGFHPELSGRENIFLNGAILGMRADEVRAKFDQIVDFAEVNRFLDTPVKHYSSGMYVRLAFAVAAHLEPDLLVVDEVLAVGDAEFQRRCMGRMEELSESGRTIIFVTHNMDAMSNLCNRGVVLDRGRVAFDGAADDARKWYIDSVSTKTYSVEENAGRGGSGGAKIRKVWLETRNGDPLAILASNDGLRFCLAADIGDDFLNRDDLGFSFTIDTIEGARLFTAISSATDARILTASSEIKVGCEIDNVPLIPGKYLVSATIIFRGDTLDCVIHCAHFEILPRGRDVHVERMSTWGALDLPCKFHTI